MTGLRKRVTVGFLSIVCLLFFSGMISLLELGHLSRDTGEILKANARNIELAKEMLDAAHEQNMALIRMSVFGDRSRDSLCRASMDRLENTLLVAQNEASRQNTLQSLRAFNGNIPLELTATDYPAAQDIISYDEFYGEIMSTDAAILSAEASVDAAAQEIKVNKQNWLPKFEVGYRRNTSMNEAANGFLVGASIPLFSSRNKTKIAEARHTAAQSELENARMQAETQLMSKYNEIQQIRSAVEAYDVPLMHSTLDALKTAVLEGQLSIIDYYVEADNVYNNLSAYLTLENQYRRLLSELYQNRL